MGFPMPRSTPQNTSLIPQIKYVLDTIIIFSCEYAITAGFEDMIDDNCPEKIAESEPKDAAKAIVINIALTTVCLTLLRFPAPIFCATYGATAYEGARAI